MAKKPFGIAGTQYEGSPAEEAADTKSARKAKMPPRPYEEGSGADKMMDMPLMPPMAMGKKKGKRS